MFEQREAAVALLNNQKELNETMATENNQNEIIRASIANSAAVDRRIESLQQSLTVTEEEGKQRLPSLSSEFQQLEAAIANEQKRITRKIIEQLIGDEATTGNNIFYRKDKKDYAIRKPNGELVRTEKKIAIAFTASITTGGGHDKNLDVEITSVTMVAESDKNDIKAIELAIDRATIDYLIKNKWGNLMPLLEKKGIEYNGESQVRRHYRFSIPDYHRGHVKVERKSKYIPEREYDGDISL
jgi:regulator of RNase E activity RraB